MTPTWITVGFAVLLALVSAAVGAAGLSVWWFRQLKKPEFARDALSEFYKSAKHHHFLQPSPTDDRKVCPCCGWTEEKQPPETVVAEPDVR